MASIEAIRGGKSLDVQSGVCRQSTTVPKVDGRKRGASKAKQEKPTICGYRAADVLANCSPVNSNANQLNTLVHLPLL